MHLVEKFLSVKEKVEQIHALSKGQQGHEQIEKISNEILEEL